VATCLRRTTARRDRREAIFLDDRDRELFLETLGEACEKTGWQVHRIIGEELARRGWQESDSDALPQAAQQGDAYPNSVISRGSIWKMKSLRLERMASPPLLLR
jgi:hypothetical protein